MKTHSRLTYSLCIVVMIVVAFTLRWPALGLPWSVGKFGGATLWAAMVYFLAALLLPAVRQGFVYGFAVVVALGVEFSQLVHIDWLDAFRRTPAGALLIGRYFSWGDVAAYFGGVTAAALFDRWFIRRGGSASARDAHA
jgi:hypothetical protein